MPQGKRQGKKTQIRVTDCRHVYSGVNQRGDQYSIYEIDAVRPRDGGKIDQKMRCFTALPVGQVIDVTAVPFESERHGKSYTLYPETGPKMSTTQQINELQEQLVHLRGRVQSLAERLELVEARGVGGGVAPTEPPSEQSRELDAQFGADAPW